MTKEEKQQRAIKLIDDVEEIKEFFTQWWSVADLYESTAKVVGTLMRVIGDANISTDEKKDVQDLIDQHLMMIDLIKPFEKKGDEV